MYKFCNLFLLFMIYSFLGYIVEVIAVSINSRKLVLNRGFLIGPYIPIYGICCILMNFFLIKYENDILALFVMSVLLCSIAEFTTSYVLEKIFKVRWWDYSQMKFNLDGRVCLLNSTLFGIGGVVLIHIINPILFPLLKKISPWLLISISLFLMIVFIIDLIITVITLCKINVTSKRFSNKDATEEVKDLVIQSLKKGSFFVTRLLNAFPRISGRDKNRIVDIKKKVNEIRTMLKENKEKLKTKYDQKKES